MCSTLYLLREICLEFMFAVFDFFELMYAVVCVLQIEGQLAIADPLRGCQPLSNSGEVKGKLVMIERGDCMFVDKVFCIMYG